MIRAGSSISRSADPERAAAEVIRAALDRSGSPQADLVFLFASEVARAAIPSLLAAARREAGVEAVIGCTGMGVLTGAGEVERAPAVASLVVSGAEIEPLPFFAEGPDAGENLVDLLAPHVGGSALLAVFPDTATVHPGELLASLRRAYPDLPVVGGSPVGSPLNPAPSLWCERMVSDGGISGVLLRGTFTALTGVAQGCQPFGQAYAITRADGHIVQEIAFSPAVDALKEALDTLGPDQKENVGPAIFVGLAMDEYATHRGRGDFVIRSLIGMSQDDGSLAIDERVQVGQTLQFNLRTRDAAHADLESTLGALANRLGGLEPRFGLYFNCLGRGFGLFGQPDHDVNAINRYLGDLPLAGFFGNAEIAPVGGRNFVHSYTGAAVVIAEEKT